MEVISVGGIIVGRQKRAENAATRIARFSEKFRGVPWGRPVGTDCYSSAIREDERRYVDSVARSVFAPPRTFLTADPPAIVGSIMLQRDHARTEVFLRRWLHALTQPQRQTGVHGTGSGSSAGMKHKATALIRRKHGSVGAPAGTLPSRRQNSEPNSASQEECPAFVRLRPKPSQLSSSSPSGWIVDI